VIVKSMNVTTYLGSVEFDVQVQSGIAAILVIDRDDCEQAESLRKLLAPSGDYTQVVVKKLFQ